MPTEAAREILARYAREVRQDRQANPQLGADGTGLELLLAPRFQSMVEALLGVIFPAGAILPRVIPEYRRGGIGRPDLAFARRARAAASFIELKSPDKRIEPTRLRGHDKKQFERFCDLPIWALSNFHSITLYQRQNHLDAAIVVPVATLEPETNDAVATRIMGALDPTALLTIIEQLAMAQPLVPRSAQEAAESLAHAARLVRGLVADIVAEVARPQNVAAATPLIQVREEFRDVLFARPKAGGYELQDVAGVQFNELFASAFAQTLSFGLLLAREAAGEDVDETADRLLPVGTYPLLKVTLQALLLPQVADELGIGLDILLGTVNAIDPNLLVSREGVDPILYFYEDFLAIFDPRDRQRHGVYFTPVPVVQYMVQSVDRVLRDELRTDGLLDEHVLLLDPACGTGTFLIAAATAAASRARQQFGDGAIGAELASLATRLNGFELLVGAYTVAHYRLHRELVAAGAHLARRLPIYLADTLAPAGDARGIVGHIPFIDAPIVEERRQADQIKSATPILAILGNPPYRRLRATEVNELVGPWVNQLWDDFKAPVRNAGWGLELNAFPDLYVAFYRWAIWKLFEREGADGRGVLCFITNRRFLAGHTMAGMRQMLRRRFDRIEIVDLRGDSKAALPAGVENDENVFAIQVGVCILTAWAARVRPDENVEAEVWYADVFQARAFSRVEKLDLLDRARANPNVLRFERIAGNGLDDFRPAEPEFSSWPSMADVLVYRSTGIVTYRDGFSYATTSNQLEQRIRAFLAMPLEQARKLFHETRDRVVGPARVLPFSQTYIERIAYRPFDIRWLYNRREYIDFPKTELQEIWGTNNVAFIALPRGTGDGPAVWVHALKPDQHSFRGSYGGFIFPLYDHNPVSIGTFVRGEISAALTGRYQVEVTADQVFNAVTCLLSASTYVGRFGASLEDSLPRIPLPADVGVFRDAVAIGEEIRALESFVRAAREPFLTARIEGEASAPVLTLPPRNHAFGQNDARLGTVMLRSDNSQRMTGVPIAVWQFEVSGYPILWKWLDHRRDSPLDAHFYRELLDVVARIAELIELMARADSVLERALVAPLTKTELGIA